MKIGIISTTKDLDWAATDEVWSRFANLALAEGHNVAVTAHHRLARSERLQPLLRQGLKVFSRHPFRPTKLFLFKERILPGLGGFARFRPDVVLFNGGSIFDAFYQPDLHGFCSNFSGPIIFLCHGHSEQYEVKNRDELLAFLSTMAWIVFLAEENKRTLETQLATSFSHASVIRNSSPILLDAALPWPTDGVTRMACVARLDAFWKGHDVLLRTLSQPPWPSRDWRLDICGEGKDEAHLRQLVDHLGLGERVTLRGQVRDMIGLWTRTHLMVLPSRAESFSLAMLEAMMCGRPGVYTDVGDARAAVEEGRTGFLAEAATPYSLGHALERAWQRQADWEEMGVAAHRRAIEFAKLDPPRQLMQLVLGIHK